MTFSTLTSMAFLPAVMLLAAVGSPLALIYAASFVATLAYHLSAEQRWRRVDHALAWTVIASNSWMSINTQSVYWTSLGLALVLVSLFFYRQAHRGSYHLWHSLWHLAGGAACFCFALGFVG